MSSAGAAARARETVRSHLKGVVCEADLLHVQKTCTQHTHTHEARVRDEQRTHTQYRLVALTNGHATRHHVMLDNMPVTLAERQIITVTGAMKRAHAM